MSLKRILYSLFLYLLLPLVIFRLLWRSRSNVAYRQRIAERLGFISIHVEQPVIWLHAVSVGETIAAKPLIEALLLNYPNHRVLVTTTTPTGSAMVTELFSDRVEHVYFPYDLPDVIFRFIRRVKPQILVVVETEIWPNLYASCANQAVPIVMVNARLSPRSTRAYEKIKPLVSATLAHVNMIAVRSNFDAECFKRLGAADDTIDIVGNIKFDSRLNDQQIQLGKTRKKQWGNERLVWVAASTHQGEDELILEIYSRIFKKNPRLVLVLIPRHPERFDEVFQLCQSLESDGVKTVRHRSIKDYHLDFNIVLGDTMGEMQSWIAAADVVFIGGSLVETGGHNPLEATMQGIPVVSGVHMFNFADISHDLEEKGLLTVCDSTSKLETSVINCLDMTDANRDDFSRKASNFMTLYSGVTERLMKHIASLL